MKKQIGTLIFILTVFLPLSAVAATDELPIEYPEDVLTVSAEEELQATDPDAVQFGRDQAEHKRHPSFVKMEKETTKGMQILQFYPFNDFSKRK